ncbi:uncharacterized protein [Periplaneta americana]|uniref:uncharacterized protein isoform X2 n=1 Tax=Periplaneta americana TaxID=6978 RepID=UPI0037E932D4
MVYCCVPFCRSEHIKGSDVSFHHFPLDDELKMKWCLAIYRQGDKPGTLWSPSRGSRVCSKHFKEADFSISTTRKRLLPKVIPSVFEYYPKHKQISSSISKEHKVMVTEVQNDIFPAKRNKPDADRSTLPLIEANVSIAEVHEVHKRTAATMCSIENKLIPNISIAEVHDVHKRTAATQCSIENKLIPNISIAEVHDVHKRTAATQCSIENKLIPNVSIAEVHEVHKRTADTQCSIANKLIPKIIKLQHEKMTKKIRKQSQLIRKLRQKICDLKSKLCSFETQYQNKKHDIENKRTCQSERKRRHNTRGRMSSKKQRADTESDTSSETSKMTVSNSSEEAAIGDPICKTEVTVSNSSEDAPFCAAVCKTEMTVSNSSEDAPFCASVCKTEVHILDDVTIKTELTDETYAESQNCILGDLVPKQETPKCE